jgi:polysaccharide export outer membrane protein
MYYSFPRISRAASRGLVLSGLRLGAVVLATALWAFTAAAQQPASAKDQKEPQGTVQTPNDLRPESSPELAGSLADPKTFKIGPEDVIEVRVWKEPELSGVFAVRPDGRITLNLVGEVEVAGLTPMEVQQKLTAEFGKVLNTPVVGVSMRAIRSSKYYITGNVNRTGMFPLVVKTTVLEALTLAGGLGEWANKKKITILRNGKERLYFNYNEVIKGKKIEQNIELRNGDFIIVE